MGRRGRIGPEWTPQMQLGGPLGSTRMAQRANWTPTWQHKCNLEANSAGQVQLGANLGVHSAAFGGLRDPNLAAQVQLGGQLGGTSPTWRPTWRPRAAAGQSCGTCSSAATPFGRFVGPPTLTIVRYLPCFVHVHAFREKLERNSGGEPQNDFKMLPGRTWKRQLAGLGEQIGPQLGSTSATWRPLGGHIGRTSPTWRPTWRPRWPKGSPKAAKGAKKLPQAPRDPKRPGRILE